jgi:hypothetical protein
MGCCLKGGGWQECSGTFGNIREHSGTFGNVREHVLANVGSIDGMAWHAMACHHNQSARSSRGNSAEILKQGG